MIFLASAYLTELAVLAFAALGKIGDLRAFAASVAEYRIVPPRHARTAACLVVAAELASVALLAVPATRRVGAVLAAGLCATFLVAMSSALRRGLRVDCGCFSPGQTDPIGPGSLTRTGLLLVLAALAVLGARQPFRPADLLVAILMGVLVITLSELVRLLLPPIGQMA